MKKAMYALYRQWGKGLSKVEESETKISIGKEQKNFVILRAEKKCYFDDLLPRKKTYLADTGISIVKNAISEKFWR